MILMTKKDAETAAADKYFARIMRAAQRLRAGFEDLPLTELNKYVYAPISNNYRNEAACQLAAWYINFDGKEYAEKALPYLDLLIKNSSPQVDPINVAVLRAEALLRVGRWAEARNFCIKSFEKFGGQDMMLACANLFAFPEYCPLPTAVCDRLRLDWINCALRHARLEEFHLVEPSKGLNLDNIAGPDNLPDPDSARALVTVIVAVYNAEKFIATALKSLQAQSWRNLEIIVVDDASGDGSCDVVEKFVGQDPRIRLIRSRLNRGDSYSRNLALAEAKGDFVAILDADDFAHPRKIQTQAEELLANVGQIANRSNHMRVMSNLAFVRKVWFPGLRPNFSSLMFRRAPVMEKMGYWDSVRITGDSEFFARMKAVFGKNNVRDIPTGLLGLSRMAPGSLTGKTGPGRLGFLYGVRREYREASRHWHKSGEKLYVEFPMIKRPFAVPKMLEIGSRQESDSLEKYDIVYASDIRQAGDENVACIEEIRALSKTGLNIGIMRLDCYHAKAKMPVSPMFRKLLNDGMARLISYPEEAQADLVALAMPQSILEHRLWTPKIRAKKVVVICGRTPVSFFDGVEKRLYHPEGVDRRIVEQFGVRGAWHPVSPLVRFGLEAENADIIISPENWRFVIDVDEWSDGREGPVSLLPAIGRHCPDNISNWPETPERILHAYPEREEMRVILLGGARTALKMLGRRPFNWTVYKADSIHPRDFLKQIDVFVYFPHGRLCESSGREILEAMAVGVPVMLPHIFGKTFGDAALYCEPQEVVGMVNSLCYDNARYRERVKAGRDYVRKHHGLDARRRWLERMQVNPPAKERPTA